MSHIVVSNTGEWDPQCIGVVGVLKDHREFRSFCDNKERLENNSVPRSLEYNGDEDTIYALLNEHEMSNYHDGVIVDIIVFPNDDPDILPNIYLMVAF